MNSRRMCRPVQAQLVEELRLVVQQTHIPCVGSRAPPQKMSISYSDHFSLDHLLYTILETLP